MSLRWIFWGVLAAFCFERVSADSRAWSCDRYAFEKCDPLKHIPNSFLATYSNDTCTTRKFKFDYTCFDIANQVALDFWDCADIDDPPASPVVSVGQCSYMCRDRTTAAERYVDCDDIRAFDCHSHKDRICTDSCPRRVREPVCVSRGDSPTDPESCAGVFGPALPPRVVNAEGPIVSKCRTRPVTPFLPTLSHSTSFIAFLPDEGLSNLPEMFFPDATYVVSVSFDGLNIHQILQLDNSETLSLLLEDITTGYDKAKGTHRFLLSALPTDAGLVYHAAIPGQVMYDMRDKKWGLLIPIAVKVPIPETNARIWFTVHGHDVTQASPVTTLSRNVEPGVGSARAQFVQSGDEKGDLYFEVTGFDASLLDAKDIQVIFDLPIGWSLSGSSVCTYALARGGAFPSQVKWSPKASVHVNSGARFQRVTVDADLGTLSEHPAQLNNLTVFVKCQHVDARTNLQKKPSLALALGSAKPKGFLFSFPRLPVQSDRMSLFTFEVALPPNYDPEAPSGSVNGWYKEAFGRDFQRRDMQLEPDSGVTRFSHDFVEDRGGVFPEVFFSVSLFRDILERHGFRLQHFYFLETSERDVMCRYAGVSCSFPSHSIEEFTVLNMPTGQGDPDFKSDVVLPVSVEHGAVISSTNSLAEIDGLNILIPDDEPIALLGEFVSLIIGVSSPMTIESCTSTLYTTENASMPVLVADVFTGTVDVGARHCPVSPSGSICPFGYIFTVKFPVPLLPSRRFTLVCVSQYSSSSGLVPSLPRSYAITAEFDNGIARLEPTTGSITFKHDSDRAGFAALNDSAFLRFSLSSESETIPDSNTLQVALHAQSVVVTEIQEGLFDVFATMNRHFASLFPITTSATEKEATASFIESLFQTDGGVSLLQDTLMAGIIGSNLCGPYPSEPLFRECEIANDCGSNTTFPRVCVGAVGGGETVGPLNNTVSCPPIPAEHLLASTGCGSWQCTAPDGSFVSCDSPAVCINGCSEIKHMITQADIDGSYASFQPHCVKGGVAVESVFCPADAVEPPHYATECSPISDCQLICADSSGNATACAASSAWSHCSMLCGVGTQMRHVACSANSTDIGDPIVQVDMTMCDYADFPYDRERSCTGIACAQYKWLCAPAASIHAQPPEADAFEPCEEESWGACDTGCGNGIRYRSVKCTAYDDNDDVVSVGVPDQLCRSFGEKPAALERCVDETCANSEWKCYSAGGNPNTPVSCADGGGFNCPDTGCGAVSGVREVACYHEGKMVLDAGCVNITRPEEDVQCSLVTTTCAPSLKASPCEYTSEGVHDEALGQTKCFDSDSDNFTQPFRRLACIDPESGAVVDDSWCPDQALLLHKCALPPCDSGYIIAWKSTPGACTNLTSLCATYRVNKVQCVGTADGKPSIVVEDNACPASSRPRSVFACGPNEGAVVCRNGGTCKTTPVTLGGITYPEVNTGSCVCAPGFGGVGCRGSITVEEVSVHLEADDYVIRWSLSAQDFSATAYVALSGDEDPIPATLGVISASALRLSVPVSVVARSFPPGNYTVSVTVGGSIAEVSLTHRGLCFAASHNCLNDGHCSDETGSCECAGEFSGPRCQTSPCANKGCNIATSQCITSDKGVASCVCATDDEGEPMFADELCNNPVNGCSEELPSCSNGGYRAGYIVNRTAMCGACTCTGEWLGDTCNHCGLDDACVNGHAKPTCDTCECNRGYHGDTCACRAVFVTMSFHRDTALEWYPGSSTTLGVWFNNIARAVRHILGDDGFAVSVHSHTKVDTAMGRMFIQVTLLIGPPCGTSADAFAALSSDPEMFLVYASLQDLRAAFASGAVVLVDGLKEANHEAGLGLEDPNCPNHSSSCPRNLGAGGVIDIHDNPAVPGKREKQSGLSSNGLIGVIVGCIAAVVFIVLLGLAFWFGWLCFGRAAKTEETEVEMEEAPTATV